MRHLRKKATDIPVEVRMEVAIRDNGNCIICGKSGVPNAHYIKRSQGGLGIPQNIVTLCPKCHYEQDFGKETIEYTLMLKNYLKSKYDGWNEEDLKFKKYKGLKF